MAGSDREVRGSGGTVSAAPSLVYILGAFPASSQTFVAREIRILRRLGLPLRVFALGLDRDRPLPEGDEDWARTVAAVPHGLSLRLLAAHVFFLRRAVYRARYLRAFLAVARLPHRPRFLLLRALYAFWRVAPIARELLAEGSPRHVHAHFAVSQTEAALALAALLDCGFSFTAHARDIYAAPNALPEKMRAARFVVTCTGYNGEHLRRLCPDLPADHVQVIPHGVPLPCAAPVPPAEEPGRSLVPPLLLSAGRLIEKKGFETLLAACARLHARGVAFDCGIAGDGPLSRSLSHRIERSGLGHRVQLLGWKRPSEMEQLYEGAAVFVLASRVTPGGDRDGLPNVLVEALAHGVPVVSTRVSAIPELVIDGHTGLLVPPDDPEALAAALERLLADPELRRRLAEAGRRRVAERFEAMANARRLARLFEPLLS